MNNIIHNFNTNKREGLMWI